MGSRPPNPIFALQTCLPCSPGAGTHSASTVVCHRELVEHKRCGYMKPLPSGRKVIWAPGSKHPADGTVSLSVCLAGGEESGGLPACDQCLAGML